MKIKKDYYCLVDENNKPDYDLLFENLEDAQKRLDELRAFSKAESIFSSSNKNTVDGIICSDEQGATEAPCFASSDQVDLSRKFKKIKKLSLLDGIRPEKIFSSVKKSKLLKLSFSKVRERENWTLATQEKIRKVSEKITKPEQKAEPQTFLGVDWQHSLLRTKAFATAVTVLCFVTTAAVFGIHHQTTERLAQLQVENSEKNAVNQVKVMGAKDAQLIEKFDDELETMILETLARFENLKTEELESEILQIVKGTPMEEMANLIAQRGRTVAAFMIAIGMKESRFGIHSPVDENGNTCFNYWGYTLRTERKGTGGNGHKFHSCFDSNEEAVKIVGDRIEKLVQAEIDTPEEMVLWKCGSDQDCKVTASSKKWVSDVNLYFDKINSSETE